jgi:hypothetical protein
MLEDRMAKRAVCDRVPPRGLFQAEGCRSITPNRGQMQPDRGLTPGTAAHWGSTSGGIIQLSIKLLLMRLLVIYIRVRRSATSEHTTFSFHGSFSRCIVLASSCLSSFSFIESDWFRRHPFLSPVPSLKEPQSTAANFVTIILVSPCLTVHNSGTSSIQHVPKTLLKRRLSTSTRKW